MSIKVVTVVGARPQFIKAAARVARHPEQRRRRICARCIVHTGQHFDDNMSKVFFDELDIPAPNYDLDISGGSHAEMTGRMLSGIETGADRRSARLRCWSIGDTNSTLAGALAAVEAASCRSRTSRRACDRSIGGCLKRSIAS